MKKLKKLLKVLGFIVFFVILPLLIIFYILHKVFVLREPTYIASGISAFMAAFAVYSFTVLRDHITRVGKRRSRAHSALVKSEYILNYYLTVNFDNWSLLDNAIKSFERKHFHVLNFKYFDINKDIISDFTCLDLINEYFSFNIDLYRFNESAKTSFLFYSDIKTMREKIPKESYDKNLSYFNDRLKILRRFCDLLDGKIRDILSKVRVLAREEEPVYLRSIVTHYSNKHKQKFADERKKVEQEIVDMRKKSKSELESYGL